MIREIREISKTLTSMEGGNRQELEVPTWPHCCGTHYIIQCYHGFCYQNHTLSWVFTLQTTLVCVEVHLSTTCQIADSAIKVHRTLSSFPQCRKAAQGLGLGQRSMNGCHCKTDTPRKRHILSSNHNSHRHCIKDIVDETRVNVNVALGY